MRGTAGAGPGPPRSSPFMPYSIHPKQIFRQDLQAFGRRACSNKDGSFGLKRPFYRPHGGSDPLVGLIASTKAKQCKLCSLFSAQQ